MPMDFDFDEGNREPEFWTPTDGEYSFTIHEVSGANFRPSAANPNGSSGYKFELLVDAGGRKPVKSFENIITRGNKTTTWKLRQICDAIGIAYNRELEPWDFENKSGRASFVAEKRGRYTDLSVDSYISKQSNTAHASPLVPPVPDDDTVPF